MAKYTVQLELDDIEVQMLSELAAATGRTLEQYLRSSIVADWHCLCDQEAWAEEGSCETIPAEELN